MYRHKSLLFDCAVGEFTLDKDHQPLVVELVALNPLEIQTEMFILSLSHIDLQPDLLLSPLIVIRECHIHLN